MNTIGAPEPSTQSKVKSSDEHARGLIPRPIATLLRALFVRDDDELSAADAASTLFRFFRSKHVADLRFIFVAAIAVFFIHVFVIQVVHLVLSPKSDSSQGTSSKSDSSQGTSSKSDSSQVTSSKSESPLITYLGPAITLYGAVLAWAYLTAGKRLGVVDLFACEIATLCRVGTVCDIGDHYVKMYGKIKEEPAMVQSTPSTNFVSQENYFPIFDNNSRDLQTLEALVVSNITEFYTYMKSARDSLRKLAEVKTVDAAEQATANLIYMLFLGYESGRKAIKDLIEFQPTAAENMIVILLTELKCYSFLCEHFKSDDLRFKRLQLRKTNYKNVVEGLLSMVNKHGNEEYWFAAQRTIAELQRRYEEASQTLQRCEACVVISTDDPNLNSV
jgi:hypothetical protein